MHTAIILLIVSVLMQSASCINQTVWCRYRVPVLKTRTFVESGLIQVKNYRTYEARRDCCKGYEPNGLTCKPKCNACPAYSICTAPNTCSCQENYMPVSYSPLRCKPIFKRKCLTNAHYTSPGHCECNTGYHIKAGKCEPTCEPACGELQFCNKRNKCECQAGYALIFGTTKCVPVCFKVCPAHSKCVGPEVCVCLEGYKMEHGVCKPVCEQDCVKHSSCKTPNQCACDEGYGSDAYKHHECVAKCQDCEHGICVAPGKCDYFPGYERSTQFETETTDNKALYTKAAEKNDSYETSEQAFATDYTTTDSTTIDADSTLSTSDGTEASATAQSPIDIINAETFEVCNAYCSCWFPNEITGYSSSRLSDTKCLHLCQDNSNDACLDLSNCVCDLNQLVVLCNGNLFGQADFASYRCVVPSFTSITEEISIPYGTEALESSHEGEVPWVWITACLVGVLIVVALLGLSYRYHLVKMGLGVYVVDFHYQNEKVEPKCESEQLI